MKVKSKYALLAGVLVTFLGAGGRLMAQTPLQLGNQIRVLTYNVRHCEGMDAVQNPARIGNIIRRYHPDVVALQELDSCTQRVGGKYQLGILAESTGMIPTSASAIPFQGGRYGIGILSKEKPLSVRRVPLPGREEARMLLIAEFPRYMFACTHLSLTPEDQLTSFDIIRAEAARCGKPFIVAGDWNADPKTELMKGVRKDFYLANGAHSQESWNFSPTFPSDKPDTCIDYIGIYRPTNGGLIPSGLARPVSEPVASDHRPLFGVLQFEVPGKELLYHEPYLQHLTENGVTVMYQTRALAHSWVEYGTDTTSLKSARQLSGGQEVVHDVEHKVRLDGLVPGTTYYYRVCVKEIVNSEAYSKTFGNTYRTHFYRFTVPAVDTKNFTALIFDDMHLNEPVMQKMSKLAAGIPHDFVVFNGDCLPEPRNRDHAMQIVHRLADLFNGAEIPCDFLRGNHEIRNNYSSGMLSLFDTPGGETYHAFSWGDTRFVMLDCGEDKADDSWVYYGLNDFTKFRQDQAEFLKKEIASKEYKKASRHVLMHHIPLWYGSREATGGDLSIPCRDLWLPYLEKAGIDVSINGHTHRSAVYEKGELGNPYPVVVGGGPSEKSARMLVLRKEGKTLSLSILNIEGEEIQKLTF